MINNKIPETFLSSNSFSRRDIHDYIIKIMDKFIGFHFYSISLWVIVWRINYEIVSEE